jgi:hypothetical protein
MRTAAAVVAAVATVMASGATCDSSASTRNVAQAFVGCWHRQAGPIAGLGTRAGAWSVAVKTDGSAVVYAPPGPRCKGRVAFRTTLAFSGGVLTIERAPGCRRAGAYRWLLSGDWLTLNARADGSCAVRAKLFSGRWHRM